MYSNHSHTIESIMSGSGYRYSQSWFIAVHMLSTARLCRTHSILARLHAQLPMPSVCANHSCRSVIGAQLS